MTNKAVLISIRPKWCELIANGEKTVEIRKTRPKLEPPFKCYIYCTNKKPFLVWGEVFRWNWDTEFTHLYGYSRKKAEEIWDVFNGRIMGEFICDDIRYADAFNFVIKEDGKKALEGSCIDEADLFEYLGWEKGMPRAECAPFYRWHISDLEVYDTPKELSEFSGLRHTKFGLEPVSLKRPPQNWCYVEKLEGDDRAQE